MIRESQKYRTDAIQHNLINMANLVKEQLKDSMRALKERDYELATNTIKKDDEVDLLYKEVFKDTINYIKNDETKVDVGTKLLFVSKYLERIGDHVTNICEWIIFSKNGEYVDLNE